MITIMSMLSMVGSSPRMRGTRSSVNASQRRPGIIPAYAGNTAPPSRNTSRTRDHPRVCGEHIFSLKARRRMLGSSPRMRGTHAARVLPGHRPGIIPAYAGNTLSSCSRSWSRWDHPRVCGEHKCTDLNRPAQSGSSPRMRGTPAVAFVSLRFLGDHPRVCGEHDGADRTLSVSTGSSPRMRGTPNKPQQPEDHAGIIPAYAGNTLVLRWRHGSCRDHPRVCGEHPSS